jgi:hypothetical protein
MTVAQIKSVSVTSSSALVVSSDIQAELNSLVQAGLELSLTSVSVPLWGKVALNIEWCFRAGMNLNTQAMVDTGVAPLREGRSGLAKVGQWNEQKISEMFMYIT